VHSEGHGGGLGKARTSFSDDQPLHQTTTTNQELNANIEEEICECALLGHKASTDGEYKELKINLKRTSQNSCCQKVS